MVQIPSWEANWFAASQEIPCISRNPKVHYRTHKRPPPVPILGQPNPVHIPTSHLLEIHPNIIHASTSRNPQRSLSLRFPHQDPIHPPSPHQYAPHAQPISMINNSQKTHPASLSSRTAMAATSHNYRIFSPFWSQFRRLLELLRCQYKPQK